MNNSKKTMHKQEKDKKLSARSNTRKTRRKKIALITSLGIAVTLNTGCGSNDSDLTKLSKEHDDAVENVKTQQEELEDAQEELKDAQEKVQKEQQDVIDAKKEEAELRVKLQQAKVNPSKE